MGLFRKRSNSSSLSTKLKKPQRNGVPPPEVPALPPPPIQTNNLKPSFVGSTATAPVSSNSAPSHNTGTDGFSTPVSQVSGFTYPSDPAAARSTAPSSVETMSAVSSFKKNNGMQSSGPQVQVNGQRISTSTVADGNSYFSATQHYSYPESSVNGSEFDSRPSSMTITAMTAPGLNSANRKPPPPPLQDNSNLSTLPQEWDPSIDTRFTHSPTPSESASMLSSVVYPQQPQPEQPHPPKFRPEPQQTTRRPGPGPGPNHPPHRPGPNNPHQYRPNSASQRHPSQPTTPRASSFRHPPTKLPALPENRRAQSHTMPRPTAAHRRSQIPATPGPKHLAITFTSNMINCNNRHKILLPMKNFHHPVPCITCRRVVVDGMQFCTFCSLRVCRECASRLKREWNGDISRGWGGVEPATSEFSPTVLNTDSKMVAGWGDHSPPIPAHNAVNQLTWPSRSNTERVCSLLGVPYRPKTAPSLGTHYNPEPVQAADLMHHPHFSFESALELESGASTVSPPSPVTPPAFGNTPNQHQLSLVLDNGKPSAFDNTTFGYGTPSPEILSGSNPDLVQPRPHYPVDTGNLFNTDSRRSCAYSVGNGALYRTDTQQSNTTVGKNSGRPITGGAISKKDVFDSMKTSDKKKTKGGLMSLFSKK